MANEYNQSIITNPTILVELKKCKTVRELAAHLNQMSIECSREEALRFLRTWEKLEDEREALDFAELEQIAGGVSCPDGSPACFAGVGLGLSSRHKKDPLTIADILDRMNQ